MKQVYLVLSQTGTYVSRIIRFFTKDRYNHVSVSLSPELDKMFSFARKGRYNALNAGFVLERLDSGMFARFSHGDCCVLELSVTEADYRLLKERLEEFLQEPPRYKFNVLGLLAMMFNIGVSRNNHYFCSQFVAYLLYGEKGHGKLPEKTRPVEFLSLPNAKTIYEGKIAAAMNTLRQNRLKKPKGLTVTA